MGASSAYHLALRGFKNILLLEKDQYFGQGATGRCAGGVRHQFATEINVRLSLQSLPMLDRFEEEIGQRLDYRKCGYLFLLTDPADIPVFRNSLAIQQNLGVLTEWMEGEVIQRWLPIMRLEDVIGGTFNPEDGIVDPNSVVMGYIAASQRGGALAFNEVEVIGIQVTAGRVSAVETNRGKVSSPIILNTAGPWAGLIGKMAGIEIPITPLRRQMLTTSPLKEINSDFPFVIDFSRSLYFHREGEGILTGMSNPHENPGFDQSIDPEWELVHLEVASARLPILEKAGLVAHWAGLYEVTPDAHPIFGKTPLEGFYICTGFSGHGFMHGPISGKLMAEILIDGVATSVDVSSLDLARFEEGRLIQEYNVI